MSNDAEPSNMLGNANKEPIPVIAICRYAFSLLIARKGLYLFLAYLFSLPYLLTQLCFWVMGYSDYPYEHDWTSVAILMTINGFFQLLLILLLCRKLDAHFQRDFAHAATPSTFSVTHFLLVAIAALYVVVSVTIGSIIFIVPGLFILTLFWFLLPRSIYHNRSVFDAMSDSIDLTKSRRWSVLRLIICLGLPIALMRFAIDTLAFEAGMTRGLFWSSVWNYLLITPLIIWQFFGMITAYQFVYSEAKSISTKAKEEEQHVSAAR